MTIKEAIQKLQTLASITASGGSPSAKDAWVRFGAPVLRALETWEEERPLRCATFSKDPIPADVRARMDADRAKAEAGSTEIEYEIPFGMSDGEMREAERQRAGRLPPCACGAPTTHETSGPWSGKPIRGCESCVRKYGMPIRKIA